MESNFVPFETWLNESEVLNFFHFCFLNIFLKINRVLLHKKKICKRFKVV
jgi:hypothetical protein